MAYSGRYEDGFNPKYGYNRNAFAAKTPMTFMLSKIVKVITTPIGLASEAVAHNQKRSNVSSAVDDSIQADVAQDESDWALDETNEDPSVPDPPSNETVMSESLLQERLPYPVVIPQRRPGTKARGFVQAYAPILSNSGISQSAFLAFLGELYNAQQASPVLKVIQISANLASISPEVISASVATAIYIIAKAAEEVQERWQTNTYLERANREIFVPHKLYAMIVKYKPASRGTEDSISIEEINLKTAESVVKHDDHLTGSGVAATDHESIKSRLRVASAETRGVPMVCAQLVYPALDNQIASEQGFAKMTSTAQRGSMFVNDYFDRRARMVQATADPDGTFTRLSGGEPMFASKMGDPNDARNTHLITLLTGGLIKAEPLGAKRRWEKAQKKEQMRITRLREQQSEAIAKGEALGVPAASKRFLQEDILYLMIVNMPDEDELSRARVALMAQS